MKTYSCTWKEILPSLSLSTMLNIFFTNTASDFIPNALANSLFDKDVLMTIDCKIKENIIFLDHFRVCI